MTANFFNFAGLTAQNNQDMQPGQHLRIDVPVRLDRGNVVFNISHLALFGSLPYDIAHLGVVNTDFKDWGLNGNSNISF